MSKVLVVDDSKLVLMHAEAALSGHDIEVVTLNTSDAPLSIGVTTMNENPDLVLLDVNMPALSGDQIVELLKRRSGAKVILHSSLKSDELARLVEESGADGYIEKTHDQKELLTQVRHWLEETLA